MNLCDVMLSLASAKFGAAPTPTSIELTAAPDRVCLRLRRGSTLDQSRQTEARKRGAAGPHLQAELGQPAHLCEPRPRYRPARGRRRRLRAHQRPLRPDCDHRRLGEGSGLRHRRLHAGGGPAAGGLARRIATVRTLPGPSGTAQTARPARLYPVTRVFHGAGSVEDLPGNADASPRRPPRQFLSGREGRRRRVHQRGRTGPGAVRVAGGGGDRQRAHPPGRAAGEGGPGGARRNFARGGGGLRCQNRTSVEVQPGGETDCRGSAPAGPLPGATARGHHLPARRRAGNCSGRIPAGAGVERRDHGARRGDRA